MAETTAAPSTDVPGVRDDTAPGDPLVEAMEAARDTPAQPDAADIAADDAGATAMAETMGDTIKKGSGDSAAAAG